MASTAGIADALCIMALPLPGVFRSADIIRIFRPVRGLLLRRVVDRDFPYGFPPTTIAGLFDDSIAFPVVGKMFPDAIKQAPACHRADLSTNSKAALGPKPITPR
ncbi:MAG TPA: hypothetical protein VM238_17410 [Phycisphaerae bacterium]|nr:hypothetical protein [Phycisphaerae bacterium]